MYSEPMPRGPHPLVTSSADSLAASGALPRERRPRARSERAMIRGALAGSEADLEALFRAHWPRAYRAAFLIVHDHAAAEDIAQEAFVQAIRRLDRFDRQRRFAPWLGAIVANRAIDWVRARSARRARAGMSRPSPLLRQSRGSGATPRRCSRRSRSCPPSTARWSSCATCSSTRPARSPARSSCRAGR